MKKILFLLLLIFPIACYSQGPPKLIPLTLEQSPFAADTYTLEGLHVHGLAKPGQTVLLKFLDNGEIKVVVSGAAPPKAPNPPDLSSVTEFRQVDDSRDIVSPQSVRDQVLSPKAPPGFAAELKKLQEQAPGAKYCPSCGATYSNNCPCGYRFSWDNAASDIKVCPCCKAALTKTDDSLKCTKCKFEIIVDAAKRRTKYRPPTAPSGPLPRF